MVSDYLVYMDKFGIVNVYKPVGMTSFSVVSRIRRIFSEKKAGHCGTLDPFACGVLPVCVGKATRVVRFMEQYGKTYRCTMVFGKATDTQDVEGTVLHERNITKTEQKALEASDYQKIRDAFLKFSGDIMQTPPMYSALKVDGKPLYAYAREGKVLEIKPRKVTIHNLSVERIYYDGELLRADFTVSCSKGTYIRTIANDVGEDTGFFGYAEKLERTACGPFTMDTAFTLEALEQLLEKESLEDALLPETMAIPHLFHLSLSSEEARRIRLGQRLPFSSFEARLEEIFGKNPYLDQYIAAYEEGALVAVLQPVQKDFVKLMKIERVFS